MGETEADAPGRAAALARDHAAAERACAHAGTPDAAFWCVNSDVIARGHQPDPPELEPGRPDHVFAGHVRLLAAFVLLVALLAGVLAMRRRLPPREARPRDTHGLFLPAPCPRQ